MSVFETTAQTWLLDGPVGKLEINTQGAAIANQPPIIGVVCHPHPLHGGTMDNKVVTTIARAFRAVNFHVVRFNYRGVGNSEGSYDNGVGEAQDCQALLTWLAQQMPGAKICLAGFSFGAGVAMRVASASNIACLISIAPAANHFDWQAIPAITMPWLVIYSKHDEIVPYEDVEQWLKTRQEQPELYVFENASHFFHGALITLRQEVVKYLTRMDFFYHTQ